MGTFYHTTNYNPLTGDLNNMVKIQKYKVDPKTGKGTIVAFIDEEAPYSDNPTPKHPDWNITKKKGKSKKKKKA